jgi:RAB6A-GEF complex partner protein 2
VATLLLSRTAYRLGETIHLIIDFSSSIPSLIDSSKGENSSESTPNNSPEDQIPVYAILVTLETLETIDPAIAMRSPQSITRYTRKIHAQFAESAHFARRLSFALAIPPSATPEFTTSGVGLEWRIRVEFVTPRLQAAASESQKENEAINDEPDEENELVQDEKEEEDEPQWLEKEWTNLLEEVAADDRGTVLHGVENLPVETFEVSIPVRVYGAVLGGKGESDKVDLAI